MEGDGLRRQGAGATWTGMGGQGGRARGLARCAAGMAATVLLAALLTACAGAAPGSGSASASASKDDAPESYTAATTYARLVPRYPFIHVANPGLPASVRAIHGIAYEHDGKAAQGLDLYLPARNARAAPGIVLVHGGGWRVGVRENLAPLAIRLAEHGYAAATISYRLSGEAGYPAAVQDAKAAVRWMRAQAARYGIDAGRIAIGGASAGGQIASLAGVSAGVARFEPGTGAVDGADGVSTAVQAIVNIDGLSDFTAPLALKYEDDPRKHPSAAGAWFGGSYAEKSASWREASPLFYVNPATPPILFVNSAQPRFGAGRDEMVGKLQALGIPSRVVVLPGTPHSFWLLDPWFEPTAQAIEDFLDRYLRDRQAAG